MADACFQLKGTTVTTLVLYLHQYEADIFARQLREKVDSAPQLFAGSPLYINLALCRPALSRDQLTQVIMQCRELNLQPFACKGVSNDWLPALQQLGLALLPATRSRELLDVAASQPPAKAPAVTATTKVINRPVRSGQQVYAKGGDLILLAPVNEGAEIIADGNIHVYNTLRGRALAGVNGNPGARIFCQQLEAELVSIAGHFMLNDALRERCWKQAAQIYLENESLQITAL
jgi:septum site-determining protein MinC